MKKRNSILIFMVALFLTIATVNTKAQLNNYDLKVGMQVHYARVWMEFEPADLSYLIRPFVRYELGSMFDLGLGVGYGSLQMNDNSSNSVKLTIIPADLRLIFSPLESDSWNPYLYAGVGAVYYTIDEISITPPPNTDVDSKTDMMIPAGLGVEFALSDHWLLDVSLGLNLALTDGVNGYETPSAPSDHNKYDKWWTAGVGIAYSFGGCDTDPDKDGLSNCEEEILGTNPEKADSDDDGLLDGEEIQKYNSDPLNPDTDGDKLKDGEEVNTHQTSPIKADTDDDELNDFAEVITYKSDPLTADTDGDTLNDGIEVNTYKTDPTKADTDGDKLNDAVEINKHKTSPIKADTDGGSIDDGSEVSRGTNPLDASDDVMIPIVVVSSQINFNARESNLSKLSKQALDEVLVQLQKSPSMKVTLIGHTDDVGKTDFNLKLSKTRAEAAKKYLVTNGINSDRIISDGQGESNPIASNKTEEGKSKNRRVEIQTSEK